MKKIIILLISLFILYINASEVSYNIYYQTDEKHPYIKVKMEFQGSSTGITYIHHQAEWGGTNFTNHRSNLHSNNNLQITSTEDLNLSYVKHSPNQKLKFTYFLYSQSEKMEEVHQILINSRYIHINGYALFTIPIFTETDGKYIKTIEKNITYKINWHNIPPNWHITSSYGNGNFIQKDLNKSYQLQKAIYTAGNVKPIQLFLLDKKLEIVQYDQFAVNQNEIIENLQRIIIRQRKLFNDNDFPYYLVILSETSKPNYISGIATLNCLTITSSQESFSKYYKSTIAHEHLHNWFGIKIIPESPDLLYKWWSEGFTDFFSYQTSYEAGVIDKNTYQSLIAEQLAQYYSSPYINIPNEHLNTQEFWKIYDLGRLPYLRGAVFALLADNLIKKTTHNQFSLNHVIQDLYHTLKISNTKFTHQLLVDLFYKYSPSVSWETLINNYIYKGDTMNLNSLF